VYRQEVVVGALAGQPVPMLMVGPGYPPPYLPLALQARAAAAWEQMQLLEANRRSLGMSAPPSQR